MKIEQRLADLGITLPPSGRPAGTYVRARRSGNLIHISGTGPAAGIKAHRGKYGQDLAAEDGYEAARTAGLQILADLKNAVGDLDRVKGVVRSLGMVNAVPEFTDHIRIMNGCSDLFVQVFGEEAGKGARSTVGMGSLPGNISIEIEMTFEVE
ncbi:MAG: RidA family protein [Candidatus Latescibacteria bacterium]|nr:RidA family protein [Candidatus Latescibacterota bacterium]